MITSCCELNLRAAVVVVGVVVGGLKTGSKIYLLMVSRWEAAAAATPAVKTGATAANCPMLPAKAARACLSTDPFGSVENN